MSEQVVIQELLTVDGTVFAIRKMVEGDIELGVRKADSVKVNDFVEWDNVGGEARGRVIRVMREGTLNVPDSSFKIKAEVDDPAVLIQLYRKNSDGKFVVQDVRVGHKMSELRHIANLEKEDRNQNKPPAGAIAAGKRAVGWIKEGLNGDGFTSVGRRRASQLANGEMLSEDTVRRMANYFTRHEKDKQAEGFTDGEKGFPRPGRVAWDAWGGDAGKSWAQGLVDKWNRQDMQKAEDEKRFTVAPWYVPNSLDAHSEWTDPEELQKALWDYVKSGKREIRLQHVPDTVAGYWLEAMTMPFETEVPMQNLAEGTVVKRKFPEGTVFLGVQWEPWAWDLVKQGAIRGFSIGGKAARKDEELLAVLDKSASAETIVKYDKPGHPFRGNQWTTGSGAKRPDAPISGGAAPSAESKPTEQKPAAEVSEEELERIGDQIDEIESDFATVQTRGLTRVEDRLETANGELDDFEDSDKYDSFEAGIVSDAQKDIDYLRDKVDEIDLADGKTTAERSKQLRELGQEADDLFNKIETRFEGADIGDGDFPATFEALYTAQTAFDSIIGAAEQANEKIGALGG